MRRIWRNFVVRCYVTIRRWLYRLRRATGHPVSFRIAGEIPIRLFPEGQIAELLYTSRFERRDLELVTRLLRDGMNVVDVGANIGLYTILADKRVAPGGTVWAFEPSGESSERLHRNLRLNAVSTVRTISSALSDRHGGQLELARNSGRGDGERFLVDGGASGTAGSADRAREAELVPVTTLDHYFFETLEKPLRIDFMKIDIEGGELLVFQGARRLLNANHGLVIMFESTPANAERYGYLQEDLFELLRGMGYGLFCRDRQTGEWRSDEAWLKQAGNIWAARDRTLLPRWNKVG